MAASEDIVHMVRPEAISIRSRLEKSNMLPIADDDSHQKGCCLLIGFSDGISIKPIYLIRYLLNYRQAFDEYY